MSSPIGVAIGQAIKEARVAAGLTQSQLANPRYTKAYVSAIENGKCDTSVKALAYLADRLGRTLVVRLEAPE